MPEGTREAPIVLGVGLGTEQLQEARAKVRAQLDQMRADMAQVSAQIAQEQARAAAAATNDEKQQSRQRILSFRAELAQKRADLQSFIAQNRQSMPDSTFNLNRILQGFTAGGAAQFLGLTAVGTAIGGFLSNWKEMFDKIVGLEDAVPKLAHEYELLGMRVGLTAQQVQGFSLVADMAGVEIGTVIKSIGLLSRNLASGSGNKGGGLLDDDAINKNQATLQALGIAFKNADGTFKSSKEILLDIADVFKNMPDGVEKSGLAMQLFGRAGLSMIPVLNQGREGILALTKAADELGLTQEQFEKLAKAHEELELAEGKVKLAWMGLRAEMSDVSWIAALLTWISQLLDNMRAFLELRDEATAGAGEPQLAARARAAGIVLNAAGKQRAAELADIGAAGPTYTTQNAIGQNVPVKNEAYQVLIDKQKELNEQVDAQSQKEAKALAIMKGHATIEDAQLAILMEEQQQTGKLGETIAENGRREGLMAQNAKAAQDAMRAFAMESQAQASAQAVQKTAKEIDDLKQKLGEATEKTKTLQQQEIDGFNKIEQLTAKKAAMEAEFPVLLKPTLAGGGSIEGVVRQVGTLSGQITEQESVTERTPEGAQREQEASKLNDLVAKRSQLLTQLQNYKTSHEALAKVLDAYKETLTKLLGAEKEQSDVIDKLTQSRQKEKEQTLALDEAYAKLHQSVLDMETKYGQLLQKEEQIGDKETTLAQKIQANNAARAQARDEVERLLATYEREDAQTNELRDKVDRLTQQYQQGQDVLVKLNQAQEDLKQSEQAMATTKDRLTNATEKYNQSIQDGTQLAKQANEAALSLSKGLSIVEEVVRGFGVGMPKALVQLIALIKMIQELKKALDALQASKMVQRPGGVVGAVIQGVNSTAGGTSSQITETGGEGRAPGTFIPGITDQNGNINLAGLPAPFPGGLGTTAGGSTAQQGSGLIATILSAFSKKGAFGQALKGFLPAIGIGGMAAGLGSQLGGGLGAAGMGIAAVGGAGLLGLLGSSAPALALAGPIGWAMLGVGALMTAFGISGQKARKQTAEIAQAIAKTLDETIAKFNSGSMKLKDAISQIEEQRAAAVARLSGRKGGQDQLNQLLPQFDQELAQLKAQQKQVIDSFEQSLAIERLPQAYRSTGQALADLNKQVRDFIDAGGSAADAAEMVSRSLQDIQKNAEDTLLSDTKDTINSLLQEIQLEKQKSDILRQQNQQIAQIQNQGVLERSVPLAQQAAQQIQKIKQDSQKQLDSINDQLDQLHAQNDLKAQALGLTTDEVTLKQQLLDIEKQTTAEDVAQLQALQQTIAAISQSNGGTIQLQPGATFDLQSVTSQLGSAIGAVPAGGIAALMKPVIQQLIGQIAGGTPGTAGYADMVNQLQRILSGFPGFTNSTQVTDLMNQLVAAENPEYLQGISVNLPSGSYGLNTNSIFSQTLGSQYTELLNLIQQMQRPTSGLPTANPDLTTLVSSLQQMLKTPPTTNNTVSVKVTVEGSGGYDIATLTSKIKQSFVDALNETRLYSPALAQAVQ